MKLRPFSYVLTVAATIVLVSLVGLGWALRSGLPLPVMKTTLVVQARRPANQANPNGIFPPTPQVVMGTPEEGPPTGPTRYTYRNEIPEDRSKPQPLYLIDTQTGQETRLGDDSGAAFFGVMDEQHLVWYFGGFHAYTLATGEDMLISKVGNPGIHPQISGDWVAFGNYNGNGSKLATLYAANVQTQEIITLTQELPARDAMVNWYFGISPQLAAWYSGIYPNPPEIVVYDLATHSVVTRLTDFNAPFNEQMPTIYDLSPGETVVTWSGNYGYDLVTQSYFRTPTRFPPNWVPQPSYAISPLREKDRILSWSFSLYNGTQRHVSAPLIDATPSATPCVEGQNLVQNGDLEDLATHTVWQQRGNASNLLINDPPPGSPQEGQWAIRLGRYRNAQQEVRQLLEIPSGVKTLGLHFDIQVGTWDVWGGDRLEVEFIDPATGQSLLTTPVRWNSRQLPTGSWVSLEVQVEGWPGIDTPVYLVLRGVTDWAIPTDFTVDNIRLVTRCQ
jgi:hypothetical protein